MIRPEEPAADPEPGGSPGAVRRRADPRLPAYLVAGFGAVVVGVVTGWPELAALGLPFVVLLGFGMADRRPLGLSGAIRLEVGRVVEGGTVSGDVEVDWHGVADVDLLLADGRGVVPVEPEGVTGWALAEGEGPVSLPLVLRAESWGAHAVGALWARARRPDSFLFEEVRLTDNPDVRVLPTPLRLGRLLHPAEPRAVSGMHTARSRGHGTDFAELRPYRPGDRMRDISWGTSARLGAPWVRVNHPERTGTVIILLDVVFSDVQQTDALARMARAAWAVASMHLRAQDRVGLIARGRTMAWLPPRGGRRARWALLDELLAIGRVAEDPTRRRWSRLPNAVPGDALVVGVTNLRSQTFVPELLHHRRTGHTTVCLVVDSSDLLPSPKDSVDDAARRMLIAQRDAERRVIEQGGVPTVLLTDEGGVGAAVLGLRRRLDGMRHPGRARVVGT